MNVTKPISIKAQNRPNDLALIAESERLDWLSFDEKVNAAANVLLSNGVLPRVRTGESLLEPSGRVRGLASEPRLDSVV
jgi:hypothetical protein